jgi:hypothetical protein
VSTRAGGYARARDGSPCRCRIRSLRRWVAPDELR